MYNGGAEEIKGVITDFKKLATKIQQDNKKTLKERDVILQACKIEYNKLYYENEALKKRCGELEQKIEELQSQTSLSLAEACRN